MPDFTYDQFSAWYGDFAASHLEPARKAAVSRLEELLTKQLSESDKVRVWVRPSRVKSKNRTWQKLNAKYAEGIATPASIPNVIDDLVGFRVVCVNQSDQQRVVDVVSELPVFQEDASHPLAVHGDSIRNYVGNPKPSGYRAYHVNVCTVVSVGAEWQAVTCELRIRTLLQESWGELTHEDTYKPGSDLPPLVGTLSRRMADLMATLDDIAEDLRAEIDRIASVAAEGERAVDAGMVPDPEESGTGAGVVGELSRDREPAYGYVRERISSLERPLDLASLAWELQRELGHGIASNWLGHGAFMDLVLAAVPNARLTTSPPTYILPEGFPAERWATDPSTSDAPRAADLLHRADPAFPLLASKQWRAIYRALSEATAAASWEGMPTSGEVNDLARRARDSADPRLGPLARRHYSYVARALRFANQLAPRMSADEVAQVFTRYTIERATDMGVSDADVAALGPWLNSEPGYPSGGGN